MLVLQSQIILLMQGTVGTVLAYFELYMYIVFVVVFSLVDRLGYDSDLFVCNCWLTVAGFNYVLLLLI